MNLPDLTRLDWIEIRRPLSERAVPLVTNLGPGEAEVLMLALELDDAVVVLDDAFARRMAESLGLRLKRDVRIVVRCKTRGSYSSYYSSIEPTPGTPFSPGSLYPDCGPETGRRALD
jgi:hypothetical protein